MGMVMFNVYIPIQANYERKWIIQTTRERVRKEEMINVTILRSAALTEWQRTQSPPQSEEVSYFKSGGVTNTFLYNSPLWQHKHAQVANACVTTVALDSSAALCVPEDVG